MSRLLYPFFWGGWCWTPGRGEAEGGEVLNSRAEVDRSKKKEGIKSSNWGWGLVKIKRSHAEVWGSCRNEVRRILSLGSSFHIQRTRFEFRFLKRQAETDATSKVKSEKNLSCSLFWETDFYHYYYYYLFFYLVFFFNNESYTTWYQNSGVSIQDQTPDWTAVQLLTQPVFFFCMKAAIQACQNTSEVHFSDLKKYIYYPFKLAEISRNLRVLSKWLGDIWRQDLGCKSKSKKISYHVLHPSTIKKQQLNNVP